MEWVSEAIDLKIEGKGDSNEHIVIFHSKTDSNLQQILVSNYLKSYLHYIYFFFF